MSGEKKLSRGDWDRLGPTFLMKESLVTKRFSKDLAEIFNNPSIARLVDSGNLNNYRLEITGDWAQLKSPVQEFTNSSLMPNASTVWQVKQLDQETRLLCAKKWIEINRELLPDGLGLLDAGIDNFCFHKNAIPIWIDFGSITYLKNGLEGISGFGSSLLFPIIMLQKRGEIFSEDFLRESMSITRADYVAGSFFPKFRYQNSGFLVALFSLLAKSRIRLPIRFVRSFALSFLLLRVRKLEKQASPDSQNYGDISFPSGELSETINGLTWEKMALFDDLDGRWILDIKKHRTASLFVSTDEQKVKTFNRYAREKTPVRKCSFLGLVGAIGQTVLNVDLVVARITTDTLLLPSHPNHNLIHALAESASNQIAIEIIDTRKNELGRRCLTEAKVELESNLAKKFRSNRIIQSTESVLTVYLLR